MTDEELRLEDARERRAHWQRWGPYLSERAWGTVREDYSAYGEAWEYFPHDHARARAYRWNEDGIAGHQRSSPEPLLRHRHVERARPHPQGAPPASTALKAAPGIRRTPVEQAVLSFSRKAVD